MCFEDRGMPIRCFFLAHEVRFISLYPWGCIHHSDVELRIEFDRIGEFSLIPE